MHRSISINEFNHLPKGEKYSLLEDYATFSETFYIDGPFKVALFELNGYYVEVWLNQKTDKLVKAVAFDEYGKLDPFLQGIDITPIYTVL